MATYTGLDGNACTAFTVVAGGLTITCGALELGSAGLTDPTLIINSTNLMTFQIGTVDILALDDNALVLAGAANTAGHALFMQSEDGGTATAGCVGLAGAAWELRTGDGSLAGTTSNCVGGAGGALTLVTGVGGAGDATTACVGGTGGVGGQYNITGGAGGAGGAKSSTGTVNGGNGAIGGAIVVGAGAGGAGGATTGCSACSDGGVGAAGAAVTLTAGAAGNGGASTPGVGGAAGIGGAVSITSGAGGTGGNGTGCNCGGAAGAGGAISLISGAGQAAFECGAASAAGCLLLRPGGNTNVTLGYNTSCALTFGMFGHAATTQHAAIADPTWNCCGAIIISKVTEILDALQATGLIAT